MSCLGHIIFIFLIICSYRVRGQQFQDNNETTVGGTQSTSADDSTIDVSLSSANGSIPDYSDDGSNDNQTNTELTTEESVEIITEVDTELPMTTTPEPPLPIFDPPNYKFKVLKYYNEDYWTPTLFVLLALAVIVVTAIFHYYMDSRDKERQMATGARYTPNKKRKI